MIKSADKKILLVDSSKFNKVESTVFAQLIDFDVIISDKGIPEKYVNYCKSYKIDLILV